MTSLVQLHRDGHRAVAVVQEPRLRLIDGASSIMQLAQESLERSTPLATLIEQRATGDVLDYDPIYAGQSPWRSHRHSRTRTI